MKNKIDKITGLIFELRQITAGQLFKDHDENFSFLHFIALKFIKKEEPLMREIAEFLAITPPSATSLVSTLFSQGYIKRIPDKNDRRIVRIVLTDKGVKKFKKHKEKAVANMKKNLEKLSSSEQNKLIEILSKMIK